MFHGGSISFSRRLRGSLLSVAWRLNPGIRDSEVQSWCRVYELSVSVSVLPTREEQPMHQTLAFRAQDVDPRR